MHFLTPVIVSSALLASLVQPTKLEGSYIIKLKSESRTSIDAHIARVEYLFTGRFNENKIENVYQALGNMYSAYLTEDVMKQVKTMNDVEYVEADSEVRASATQMNAPWGLARLSQRAKLGATRNYNFTADGAGVSVYVLDTGIFIKHPEFEGRARFGARFTGTNDNDENGHGTHCAGTIGSRTYGVAKKANLVAVKVLNKENIGHASRTIAGINWAVKDKKGSKGNVISMSLGGQKSQAINDAIKAAVSKNIVVVVSAGNNNQNACKVSPASEPSAITVAAMDINDARASFSNWGKCVDVFGPGVNILSTWNKGGAKTISGTSMATPHVAGLAAYFLSKKSESASAIAAKIKSLSSKNLIYNPGADTSNLNVYNGIV